MISIITCSVKPEICRRMIDSVSKTVGAEYETVIFDNRERKLGISEAYNKAADTAKGDYLCFVHEDIVVKTDDWGKELIKFAERADDCGVIGIAGGKSANRNFLGWWNVPGKLIKVYDGVNSGDRLDPETDLFYHYSNPNNELFSKAVCLDGVFLFVKRDVWENNKFDEKTFKGFHFYDADFSFSISQKYQNYVYFGMEIRHFSAGDIEKTFCDNMYLFQKKWKNRLPYCLPGYKVSFRQELVIVNDVYSLYKRNVFPGREIFKRIYRINGLLFSMLFFVYFSMRSLKCRLKRLI
jgi:glycosyltransferase involved in cell wall biosynthesis